MASGCQADMRCLCEISIRSTLRETSQRSLRNTSKETTFCGVFKTSQTYLRKDVYSVTSETYQKHLSREFVIFQKYPTKMVSCYFRRVTEIFYKIDVGPLETLKK